MGIYLQNFTMIYGRPEDLEIDKDGNMRYLGAQIINIQSNLNALIIIKQNDLPVIELCKDECNENNKMLCHLFQKVHTYIVTLTIYKSKTKEFY